MSAERAGEGESEERVRLFVALELPEDVRQALGRWRSDALRNITGLRAIPPDHLHVTLCFLGWQDAGEVEAIADACRAVTASEPPELTLGEAVWLPPRRPRVLAVQLHDAHGRLAALQSELSQRLEAGGWYVPERRPYMAHVTVVRVRRQARVSPSALAEPEAMAFRASQVTLFRSHLSAAGARYEALAGMSLE
ncbi:MAG: RNA 2',3'-cyclic phosphodiesterase [Solirubrobacteraceae bacterium]